MGYLFHSHSFADEKRLDKGPARAYVPVRYPRPTNGVVVATMVMNCTFTMSTAAAKISAMDHHPRWENVGRSVSVLLSTWDIGRLPSQSDIDLACFWEELRSGFPPPKERKLVTYGEPDRFKLCARERARIH